MKPLWSRLFVVSLLALTPTLPVFASEATALRILLTNDDGYDTPGIKAIRKALIADGHEVMVVAPLRNQSGSGMRVAIGGTLDYREQAPGVWSVDGTPADSVLVGLLHLMQSAAPDIVVSGANFGPNLGYAGSSGTVGAATMAMQVGIPAIAVSVAVDPSEHDATPIPFPSTFAAFAGAAEFTAKLIGDLQASAQDGALLPAKTLLNVNYPAVAADQLAGVRIVQASWDAGVRIAYEQTAEPGQLAVRLQLLDAKEPADGDADWQWLARRSVAITVLDGDTDGGEAARVALSQRLSGLGDN